MLLFKTSALTLESVISNKKHALKHEPKQWEKDEILLISKNRTDCKKSEKQIQYIMTLNSIEKLGDADIKKYWPSSKNDWNFLVNCTRVIELKFPFDLSDILGADANKYAPSLKPKKISSEDEVKILAHLKNTNSL